MKQIFWLKFIKVISFICYTFIIANNNNINFRYSQFKLAGTSIRRKGTNDKARQSKMLTISEVHLMWSLIWKDYIRDPSSMSSRRLLFLSCDFTWQMPSISVINCICKKTVNYLLILSDSKTCKITRKKMKARKVLMAKDLKGHFWFGQCSFL